MHASGAHTIIHPGRNQYRSRVIAVSTDVGMLIQQLGKNLDCDDLTAEVAQRLRLHIDTQSDFGVLSTLVRAVRPIAREDQGGQFSLLLF